MAAPVAIRDDTAADERKRALIRQMIGPNLNDDEIDLLIGIAGHLGLDLVKGQMFGSKWGDRFTYGPTVKGLRVLAFRTGEYVGLDEIEYRGERTDRGITHPISATAHGYRLVAGVSRQFSYTAFWDECAPRDPRRFAASPYSSKPFTMMAVRAEGGMLSRAFPDVVAEFPGDVDDIETGDVGAPAPVEAPVVASIDPYIAKLSDRLTRDQQEAMINAAMEFGVEGIFDIDPEQRPGTQRWSEVVSAINTAYSMRGLPAADMKIQRDGRLNPGEIFNVIMALPADDESEGGDA